MNKQRWTFGGNVEKVRKRPAVQPSVTPASEKGVVEDVSRGAISDGARPALSLVATDKAQPAQFVVPVPGRGAPAGSLAGKVFVLTGIFPEIGGGTGFRIGKDRARKMIESFGGKVTSAVSGRTDILVVGKDPGPSKVYKARAQKTRLLSIHQLKLGLERG